MSPRRIGRYLMHEAIASGGMASVHVARMLGPVGFSRTVAIKRLHPHLSRDPEFVSMLLDEARLAGRIRHPNVVATLDVVTTAGELFLVMEFVLGESLATLVRQARARGQPVPLGIISSVLGGVLGGLHASHEATGETGDSLHIVHRDVSPQNILVGEDGVARVVDFGVAKAAWRLQSTQGDQVKGKVPYMAPEQLRREAVDRRADVYGAGVVLWEALTSERLFAADNPAAVIDAVLAGKADQPSTRRPDISPALDEVVRRALAPDVDHRFASALELLTALEHAIPPSPAREVADWVRATAGASFEHRRALVAAIERLPAETDVEVRASDEALAVRVRVPGEARALAEASTEKLDDPLRAEGATVRELPVASTTAWKAGRGRVGWMGAGALALACAVGGASLLAVRGRAPVEAPMVTATGAPPVEPLGSDHGTQAPSVETPSAAPSDVPVAPASRHARPAAGRVPRSSPIAPAPARRGAASADCDPLFTLDENGVKHFKPHCL